MLATLFGKTPPADRQIRNATLENPAVSLSDPNALNELFGEIESEAGIAVNESRSLSVGAVWQCVDMISADIAGMTLNVLKRLPGDDREIDNDHPAEHLISVQPNENEHAFGFWRRLVAHALLWQNGYAFIDRDGRFGPPLGLYNLLPDRTKPEYENGNLFYVTEVEGVLEPLYKEEVLHVTGLSLNNRVGLNLVSKARDDVGLAIAARGFSSKFFANGAQAGGILEIPPGLSDVAKANIDEGWARKYTGKDNWFRVAIVRDGVKFQQTTIDAQKSQTHELREDQAREVARFFNVPPFKLGLSDSVSYNSAEMAQLMYLSGCLNGWRHAIAGEGGLKLLTDDQRRRNTHYLEHNVSNLIEIDVKTMNEVLEIQRRNEVVNANEWRRKINLPKRRDPGGEQYLNPNTKSANGQQQPPAPAEPASLLAIPDVRQKYSWDCGAAAAFAVAQFFTVAPDNYQQAIAAVGATPRDGTPPEAIIDWLNDLGLITTSGAGLSLDDLRSFFAAGQPAIVPIQLNSTPESGHYVVVTGLGLGMVFIQDPLSGPRMMTEKEFDESWHDTEADGGDADHFAIAVGDAVMTPPQPEKQPSPADPPEDPPSPPAADDAPKPAALGHGFLAAARRLITDAVGRAARRACHAARTKAKESAKFAAWIDQGCIDERAAWDEITNPAIGVAAELLNQTTDDLAGRVAGEFFDGFIRTLEKFTEPPYTANTLPANVDHACRLAESTAAENALRTLFGDPS